MHHYSQQLVHHRREPPSKNAARRRSRQRPTARAYTRAGNGPGLVSDAAWSNFGAAGGGRTGAVARARFWSVRTKRRSWLTSTACASSCSPFGGAAPLHAFSAVPQQNRLRRVRQIRWGWTVLNVGARSVAATTRNRVESAYQLGLGCTCREARGPASCGWGRILLEGVPWDVATRRDGVAGGVRAIGAETCNFGRSPCHSGCKGSAVTPSVDAGVDAADGATGGALRCAQLGFLPYRRRLRARRRFPWLWRT